MEKDAEAIVAPKDAVAEKLNNDIECAVNTNVYMIKAGLRQLLFAVGIQLLAKLPDDPMMEQAFSHMGYAWSAFSLIFYGQSLRGLYIPLRERSKENLREFLAGASDIDRLRAETVMHASGLDLAEYRD